LGRSWLLDDAVSTSEAIWCMGEWEVYREEGMLSPGRNPGESDDLMMVRWWSLTVFRLGNGCIFSGM
jgi:hypothetical protein